jgi:hypothetical protein
MNGLHRICFFNAKVTKAIPCNTPRRPIGLLDVEDPTLSKQSAYCNIIIIIIIITITTIIITIFSFSYHSIWP